jgi:hypothetical protein
MNFSLGISPNKFLTAEKQLGTVSEVPSGGLKSSKEGPDNYCGCKLLAHGCSKSLIHGWRNNEKAQRIKQSGPLCEIREYQLGKLGRQTAGFVAPRC